MARNSVPNAFLALSGLTMTMGVVCILLAHLALWHEHRGMALLLDLAGVLAVMEAANSMRYWWKRRLS